MRAPQGPGAATPVPLVYAFLDFGEGGAQRLALAELRRLDRRRFAPQLLCLRGDGALLPRARALGVPVHVLDRLRRPRDLAAVPAVRALLRAVGARVVIGQHYSRSLPYVMAGARLARVPLRVVRHHGHAPARGAARRRADHWLQRGAAHLTLQPADARALRAAGRPREDVALLRHGIDLQRFAPGDRSAARRALGVPLDRSLILVPARLAPVKGHVDLLAALPLLRARAPRLLVLCGGDGPLHATLPALAAAADLADVMRFPGVLDDLPSWLAACDVVCLPSHVEGWPLALLEAHAAGRPVVASAVGGVPELVADGHTGLLVPPRAPADLADALTRLLRDPALRRAMGEAARARAEAHFDEAVAVRRLEDRLTRWLVARGEPVPTERHAEAEADAGPAALPGGHA